MSVCLDLALAQNSSPQTDNIGKMPFFAMRHTVTSSVQYLFESEKKFAASEKLSFQETATT